MTTEGRHAVFVIGDDGERRRVSRWYDDHAGAEGGLERLRAGAREDLLPLEVLPGKDRTAPEAGDDPPAAYPEEDPHEDLDNGYEKRPTVSGAQPFAPLGRRLSLEELGALQDGARVLMRLSRLYYPDPLTLFEGEGTVYVDGDNLTTRDRSWAEYRLPEDLDPYGGLIAEDYYMEIFAPGTEAGGGS